MKGLMKLPEDIYELVLARLAGEKDVVGEEKLRDWLGESERNREAYREFCALWYSCKWGNMREGGESAGRLGICVGCCRRNKHRSIGVRLASQRWYL
ncbi:MAG: hypothetical protein ACLUDU_12630 [Butyricimonas faecihominis]